MAEIKINKLTTANQTEMVDLKKEAEQGNSEAIHAFISLRGGCACKWQVQEF
ncbi:hypothetical protein [Nostoc sp. CMAA1605]|uniref:hypothetical protein n=1 Tax=Nostoc sp. CMAA1605 TaxID=2055159 RepID=UPI001F2249AC|nr:hypothetical protein [Nostoc sp. CMAA1605]